MLTNFSTISELPPHDVCIVGAGPIGLATALACEDAGLSVLILESGEAAPDAITVEFTAGHRVDPARHEFTEIATCRCLGGTSHFWGGRCVTFDDVDFADRPARGGAIWPIGHDEIRAYYPDAAFFFGVEPARFGDTARKPPELEGVRFDGLERWTPETDMGLRHRARLEASSRITVVLGATVIDLLLEASGQTVSALRVAGRSRNVLVTPKTTVLACGGVETARLLLFAQRAHPEAFGGFGGPLGRYYMGHPSGKIADVVLTDPDRVVDYDFFLDGGVYARRRFQVADSAQLRENLLNAAFWIDNPPFYAADHRIGILSLVWMALAVRSSGSNLVSEAIRLAHVGPRPFAWGRHFANVLRSPLVTACALLKILYSRFIIRPKMPGFLVTNQDGRYALHYHAEQAPNAESRVTLSDRHDVLGLPFVDIDLRFSNLDAESVVRSHELLDAALRRARIGRLEYHQANREDRVASVLRQARDGLHQSGTTRMAASAKDGVVDANCRVHGLEGLYIAGCSVLPTSGQASPTFVATALGVRLAHHLAACHAANAGTKTSSAGMMSASKHLLFAAPFTGDVAGTKTTAEAMQRFFCAVGSIEISAFDNAFSFEQRERRFYLLNRLGRFFEFVKVVFSAPKGIDRICYLVADGGKGFYFTLLQILTLSLAGYRTILSLRSFRLLRENPRLLAHASKIGGQKMTVMSLCPAMTASIRRAIPEVRLFECSNIVHHVPPPAADMVSHSGRLKIGFVSNIIPGKGVDIFLKIAERLADERAFEFVIAGYARDNAYFAEIGELKQPWVTWVGGVSGETKETFFRDLDVFVFPTTYPDEAQPNVVFEAARHGAQIVSTDISCLAGDVVDLGGSALAVEGFVDAVCDLLSNPEFTTMVKEGRGSRAARYREIREAAQANAERAIRGVLNADP